MPEKSSFIIRLMKRDDLDQAFALSVKEGWNQTMRDWKFLFENEVNVCIVAEKDNRLAGTATALIHENKIAWIGMVLVDKVLRGQGAGKMLLEEIISRVKHVESVKLDATPAGEPLYMKLGFIPECKIFRMTRSGMNYESDQFLGKELFKINQDNLSEAVKSDQKIFGADRSHLLKNIFSENPERAFYLKVNSLSAGYILGREGSRFNYVGPVIAQTDDSARRLISAALQSLNNKDIALDVMEDKSEFISWLESIGFVKQRHFVRMYLNSNPYPGVVKYQYLISGPEFG